MGDRIAVMNFGVLQQLGAPQKLYEKPANMFVAGFIGTPAMNFIDVKADKSDGATKLKYETSSYRCRSACAPWSSARRAS